MSTDGHSDRINLLVTPPYPQPKELAKTNVTKASFANNNSITVLTNDLQEIPERRKIVIEVVDVEK